MTAVWERYVPADELSRLQRTGFGQSISTGQRPCLLVIDVVTSFLGVRPGTREAATDLITSCAPHGWPRVPTIRALLSAARNAGVPCVFTKGGPEQSRFVGGAIKQLHDTNVARAVDEAPFPPELQPRADEYVLTKARASAFFHTPLLMYLARHRVDTLLITGTTTSGCVRATAVDAASYGFSVVVVEDACFDRSPFAHAANLFDIHMKYGQVVDSAKGTTLLTRAGAHD